MCGRYASTKDPALLAAEFDAVDGTGDEAPGADYNIAPTKHVMAVVERKPEDEELEQREHREVRHRPRVLESLVAEEAQRRPLCDARPMVTLDPDVDASEQCARLFGHRWRRSSHTSCRVEMLATLEADGPY